MPGPCLEPDPSGTRDIASTPQLIPTSMTPAAIMFAVMWDACCEDPHGQSSVVAAVSYGSPIVSQAVRAGFMDCSPAWVTVPPTICSTQSAGIRVRPRSSR